MTYFNIIEDNIKLPENFEFTSKVARYIDVVGKYIRGPSSQRTWWHNQSKTLY